MLQLWRKKGQRIQIAISETEAVWVTVTKINCGDDRYPPSVQLGIDAPQWVEVDREELLEPE